MEVYVTCTCYHKWQWGEGGRGVTANNQDAVGGGLAQAKKQVEV